MFRSSVMSESRAQHSPRWRSETSRGERHEHDRLGWRLGRDEEIASFSRLVFHDDPIRPCARRAGHLDQYSLVVLAVVQLGESLIAYHDPAISDVVARRSTG